MAKIYMYAHGGSGNHGCEAIVRSTCDMLNNPLWMKYCSFLLKRKKI